MPLSFSHINEFAFNRPRWALRRIFGYEFPTSAAAERCSAVESGLNMLFNGKDMKFASEKMHMAKILEQLCEYMNHSVSVIYKETPNDHNL